MFVFSISKKRIRLTAIIVLLILLFVILLSLNYKTVHVSANPNPSQKLPTIEDKIAYISNYGYEVDAEPFEIQEMIVPDTFDETLEKYNTLQKSQGFDLSLFCGKRIKRWSFRITNDPNSTEEHPILVNLYLYNQKVIAGDVASTKLDGNMHALQENNS